MRFACGIFLGLIMTLLLAAAVAALIQNLSAWTVVAVSVVGLFNVVIWAGFGRALYDVFLRRDYRGQK